jgi:two-component system, chemotaxis family, CheB/CheR fusion protein
LINKDREIKHHFGEVQHYLKPPEGRVNNDFLVQLSGDLKLTVSLGIQRVLAGQRGKDREDYESISRHAQELIRVRVTSFPFAGKDLNYLLVSFEPVAPKNEVEEAQPFVELAPRFSNLEAEERIKMLEDELRSTKENLQNTVEELQTSNEELQAINEEMQVSNEELQSTNEELHSMNEELHSVNAELQEKNHQLIELNNDHECLLDSTEDGVLFLDKRLRIKRFNHAIAFAFDLIYQDLGRPIEHIHYKLLNTEQMLQDVHRVISSGQAIQRKEVSSEGIYYLRRFTPFKSSNNELLGVVLTFTDLTEVNKLKGRLQQAMTSARLVWWEWDIITDQLLVHADDGNCILGYQCDSIDPTSAFWFKQLHPDDLSRVQQELQDCLTGKSKMWASEHRYVKGNSSEFAWVYEVGQVVQRDANGSALKMTGTTMNIDHRKKFEVALLESKESSEASEQAKSNFLSHMSHEIRTPLNGIIGMAELLSGQDINEESREYVDIIHQSSKLLYGLINNILDLSKVEAGKLELSREAVDIEKEGETIIGIFKLTAKAKNIQLGYQVEMQNSHFMLDVHRLRQIMMNLLGNALKFTPEGGRVNLKIMEKSGAQLYFEISDSGIGISPELQDRLFKPFSQTDTSITKMYGGSGLGLSISQQLVKLMGSEIRVQSVAGQGSTFSFSIHARPTEKDEKSSKTVILEYESLSDLKKLLIVDDNIVNLKMLGSLLKKMQIPHDLALSGHEALKLLNLNSYDALLLDIHMPVMSGFELAQAIRAGEGGEQHRNKVLIACTADVSDSMKSNLTASGFNLFLFKPVTLSDLKKVLAQLTKS